MFTRFLNPQNDYAFKKLFRSEKNKDILIELLNSVLHHQFHRPIVDVTFLSPIQEPVILAKKQSVVDVLCKDQDDCQYIIEMQIAHTKGFEERAQYYAYKAFVSQMEKGQDYYGLKSVIFLAFTNFGIFPDLAHYKSEHVVMERETMKCKLDKVKFTFVDLTKFDAQRGQDVANLSKEEKFYYFLRHADSIEDEALQQLVAEGKVLQRAFQALERASWSKEEMHKYEQEEKRERDLIASYESAKEKGRAEGLEAGIAQGMEKGMEKGKRALLKQLVEEGLLSKEKAHDHGL